jgi:hypothetical protein
MLMISFFFITGEVPPFHFGTLAAHILTTYYLCVIITFGLTSDGRGFRRLRMGFRLFLKRKDQVIDA